MAEPPASPDTPRTIADALKLPASPTVNAMLGRAGADAAAEGAGLVGLRHLILGALQLGQLERTTGETQMQFAAAFTAAVEKATGAADFPDRIRGADAEHVSDMPLSPMALAAIEQARLFARLSSGEDFVAARHLIVALTFPLRQDLQAALLRVWHTRWGITPETLRPALRDAMQRAIGERLGASRTEDRAAWVSLFGARREAPAFAADSPMPAAIDPLGYAEEAQRLAELACLGANEPPMAVALFGAWGSGKSTFMRRMQMAVEDIGRTWRDEPAAPFRTRVAQVRFNAWSYADSDLWASLAAEVFRQLKGEIARLSGEAAAGAQYRALLDRVALRLGAAEERSRAALGELARINRDLAARRDELARVERRAEEIAGASASARLMERAEALLRDKPERVADALATLGALPPDRVQQAKALVAEARAATPLVGKARLLGRLALNLLREPRGWLLLAVGGMAAAVAGSAVAWAAAPLPLLAWAIRLATPFLDAASAFTEAEAAERKSLAARHTELEAEIAALRRQRAEKERAQTTEARFLARYTGALGGESPAALLRFFLEQDESLSDYEKRLGMVSRLRESFETLEALLLGKADGGAAPDTLPAIDRIILYVDDLDRCQPEQVVPVLQALALMLQLKLFVAVVAVDERWLMAALSVHYRALIEAGAMTGPHEFLEKIFQIPFWLPPMRATDLDRFTAFVAHLVPEAEAAEEPQRRVGGAFDSNIFDPKVFSSGPEIDPDELPRPGDTDPAARASKADTIERVSLNDLERQVLARFAPLAGGTPRAVKRFINLYRLIRASRQGAELAGFLGEQGKERPFALLAFALAWQSGGDPALTPPFIFADPAFDADKRIAALRQRGVVEAFGDMLVQTDAPKHEAFRTASTEQRLAMLREDETRVRGSVPVGLALSTLVQAFGRDPSIAELEPYWLEATRFSFRRPV